jgi:hypothetical protein
MRREVNFSFIGGAHHFWHLAPVAAALSRDPEIVVRVFVNDFESRRQLTEMLARLDASISSMVFIEMALPNMFDVIASVAPKWRDLKLLRLLWWNRALRQCDALVTAERTSTILCALPGPKPFMIHIPHGAGDRAQGFEKRISRFDCIIVAGEKDRQRMVSMNLTTQESCFVSGYIKLSALRRLRRQDGHRLFHNDRPVIVYNAHFSRSLSSWSEFALRIIELIRQDGGYNLIVAPHVRLSEAMSVEEKKRWTDLAIDDRIIVDLGSDRSMDMTYTMAADIYLGDVSSQIYEFTADPRPCVFINAQQALWQHNPDYLMWELGDVIDDISQLLPTLERCAHRLEHYRQRQIEATSAALGDVTADAASIAAAVIKQRCLSPTVASGA